MFLVPNACFLVHLPMQFFSLQIFVSCVFLALLHNNATRIQEVTLTVAISRSLEEIEKCWQRITGLFASFFTGHEMMTKKKILSLCPPALPAKIPKCFDKAWSLCKTWCWKKLLNWDHHKCHQQAGHQVIKSNMRSSSTTTSDWKDLLSTKWP